MLDKKYNLNLSSEDKRLPHMYCFVKLHKQSTGSKFIIAAPKCLVKPFSKVLTSSLRLYEAN